MITKYNYKPACRYCGKPGPKDCDTLFSYEPYNGNQIIVKERKEIFGERVAYTTSVWDGETYKLNAGSFCTNRCAIAWANDHAVQPEEAQ